MLLQFCGFSELKLSSVTGSGAISEPAEIVAPAASEAEAYDGKMLVLGRVGSVPNPPKSWLNTQAGHEHLQHADKNQTL